MGDQAAADHGGCGLPHLVKAAADADSTSLSPATGVHLGLDHPQIPVELACCGNRVVSIGGNLAAGDGNASGGQQGLGLVLV